METSEFDVEMNKLEEKEEYVPLYKMLPNKIAVSKKEGCLWRDRLEVSRNLSRDLRDSWENIIRVYKGQNKPDDDENKKRLRMDEQVKTFENLVWANTNGINREVVMKLPKVQVDSDVTEFEEIAKAYEKLANNYMGQVGNCGLNCKEKLQKVDICAQLTNRGIWRLDWVDKIDRDVVLRQIEELEGQLEECKDTKEIKEIEGKLYGLNERLEDSGFDGAQITLVNPCCLFIDPNSQLESGLDADWMIEERLEYQHVLEAKYGKQVDEGNEEELYKEKVEDDGDYVLGEEERTQVTAERLKTVKVYYAWDKLKRRVYLYEDGKWDKPLWVWKDPYGLKQFFPYYILSYNQSVVDNNMMSEVAYYLPLVNSINKINSQIDKARDRAFNVTLVDRNLRLEEKDLQNMTNGKPGWVQVAPREGMKIADCVAGMPTPGSENQLLMDKNGLYAMITKLSSADVITRGEEYKTNTTNGAIAQYTQGKKVIIGIKVDKLISFYLRVVKDVLQLCLNKFDMNDLLKWVGSYEAQVINEIRVDVWSPDLKFTGDDTVEPTAAAKKQEALQITQMMGQFAGASPAIVPVVLKMLSRAFNELVITDEDWRMIIQGFEQQQQQMMMQQQQMAQQGAMQAQEGELRNQGLELSNMAKQQAMVNQAAQM